MNTFKTTSVIQAAYGEDAKYSVLKFQLENDTGNYLGLESAEDYSTLTLYTKTGEALSSVNLNHELPSILGIKDKYLYVDVNGELVWKSGTSSGGNVIIEYNTCAEWNKQPALVSQVDTIYVYTDKDSIVEDDKTILVPGIKIGDGNAYLIDKPFITDAVEKKLANHMADLLTHIQPGEREKWNNKLNFIDPGSTDLLEFTRD